MDFASLEPLPGGWSGETFVARVGTGELQVVRIHARNPGRAEVDAALLRLVRGLLPVPEVLEVRRAVGELPALLVTSYLPGERGDLVLPRLGADDQAVLGGHVGELAAALSWMPQPRAGEFVGVVDGDLTLRSFALPDGLVGAATSALASALEHWASDEGEGLLEMADLADELLDGAGRACLVHSDLNPKNLLVDPDTLEITGLVDWEYAHAGLPSVDLGNVLRFDRHPAYAEGVLAAYRERMPAAESGADLLDRARAADLWALVELAVRHGQNPVADRAERLLRAIAATRDLHASPT
ncbi:hypothetical protein BH09ACT12_BH09ACT12_34880 [soil metagenome]